jgi:putative MATE family efflux protein
VVFTLIQFGAGAMLQKVVKSELVFNETVAFLKIRSVGVFFAFLNMSFRSFFVGITKTRVITYTTFVMAGVNIVLDYVLIFGHFGAPVMGIEGAALASVIAEAVALVFFFIYTGSTIKFNEYRLFSFVKISVRQMLSILRISVPVMMQSFISLSVWFVFFLFIEKLGETSLAVSNIIRSILVLLMIPIWGFATATNTLVSYLIGLKRENEVMLLIGKILILTFSGVLTIVSFGLFFPHLVLEIYTNDPNLVSLGIPALYVVSVGALLLSVGFILFNGVSGTGKTNVSLIIEIIVVSIYLTYTYLMVNKFNASFVEVWTSEWLYGSLLAIFSFVYLKSNKWKSNSL